MNNQLGEWYPSMNTDLAVALYRREGMEPGWTRVWRDGVDVTDRPELWPEWYTNPAVLRRRR